VVTNACPRIPTIKSQDVSAGTNQRISNPLLSRKIARMNKTVVGKVLRVRFALTLTDVKKVFWFITIPCGENTRGRINQKTMPMKKNNAHWP
jgi:hypothetical protein